MGDEVKLADGLKLTARLPLPAYVRLLRHGKEVAKSEGKAEFEFAVKEPGAYRLEAWLKLDGELRPWIFANPDLREVSHSRARHVGKAMCDGRAER